MAKTVSDPTNHHSSVGSSCLISMIRMYSAEAMMSYVTRVIPKGNHVVGYRSLLPIRSELQSGL